MSTFLFIGISSYTWHSAWFNLPKRTKLGKGDNSPSFFWSVSWPAFSFCILLSSRLSHESVSKAPLCTSASNVAPFPAGSLNINNQGMLFPHQYTSILILQGPHEKQKLTLFFSIIEIMFCLRHYIVIQTIIN